MALFAAATHAQAAQGVIDVQRPNTELLGRHFSLLVERDGPLNIDQAYDRFSTGQLPKGAYDVLSFGLNSEPLWLFLRLSNGGEAPVNKQLSIEASWLDRIELYLYQGSKLTHSSLMGDALPYAARPQPSNYFVNSLDIPPGDSVLILRISSSDPMVLPIRLSDHAYLHTLERLDAYHYGFLYGLVVALMLYNLLLFLRLRSPPYLFYSIYMLAFVTMNIAYSGHGFAWLWSDSVTLQKWSNALFMTLYSVAGLSFAVYFLDVRSHARRLARLIDAYVYSVVFSIFFCIAFNLHALAIVLSFVYVFIFSIGVLLLGIHAVLKRRPSADYFLAATLIGAIGAGISCITVWGWIPFTRFTYLAVELGLSLEAVLLSLAVADRFNLVRQKKEVAERLARIDPLTELYNRRASRELLLPHWEVGNRQGQPLSVIIIDIDHFKQINDSYGHDAGDQVIVQVANLIKRNSRADDIAVRWGGEEFLIYLPGTRLQQAGMIAERLRCDVGQQEFTCNGSRFSVTCSFGVAERSSTDTQPEQLFKRADELLYQAKQSGRNQVMLDMQNTPPAEVERSLNHAAD